MLPHNVIHEILSDKASYTPRAEGKAFAASNIALCKYWGKRNTQLNLPTNPSLSISLNHKGTHTRLAPCKDQHRVFLDDQECQLGTPFYQRAAQYLDFYQPLLKTHFEVYTTSNIPIAAGLASSASGFAALALALDNLYDWQLPTRSLSILARLGSGSASRSIEKGFVLWHKGNQADGMDSFAEPLQVTWPTLRIGLCLIDSSEKSISSRKAMQQTSLSSPFFTAWEKHTTLETQQLEKAIHDHDFNRLGEIAESNALCMHALMQSAHPPIFYSTPDTFATMQKIWNLRKEGLFLYFTQDAGPNLKLLFQASDQTAVLSHFPLMEVIVPFA
jgi:diphosphomevalonate decarboxylase